MKRFLQPAGVVVSAFARSKRGTSAIEFALCSPILLAGLLVVTDVGLALNERMQLDQATRSGAEFAMNSVDDGETIENMVKASATGSYDFDDVDEDELPDVEATQFCECPDAPGTEASCNTLCTGDVVPSSYWHIESAKDYDGVFVPTFELHTEITVQTR